MADRTARHRRAHRHGHHRPRLGRHPRAQHAAAALVAVAVLRDDRLVDRLLDRLSVLAAGLLLHARACSTGIRARRSSPISTRSRRSAARWSASSPRPRCRRSRPIRSCSTSRARRGGRPSPRTARPATAPAAAAPRAIPISTTTTGSGAASSTRSRRPSATASAPAIAEDPAGPADAGLRPRRHAQARRHRDGRRLRALARRACRSTPRPISPPARRSSPTTAPSVTATTARAIASSARPI